MKRLPVCLFLLLLLTLLGTGCGGNDPVPTLFPTLPAATEAAAPAATATVEPADIPAPQATDTAAPSPTNTAAPQPAATEPLTAEATAAEPPELSLAASTFTHTTGAFSLTPPAGWTSEEGSEAVGFEEPDGSGFIYVQITNTGYELEAEAFTNFVTNRDLNYFRVFEEYEVISEDVDAENGVATVTKYLVFDGAPQTVVTVYEQYGSIIYTYDFWSDEQLFDAYDVLYGEVLGSVEVNPEAAAGLAVYAWSYEFPGPDDLFTIRVPTPWQYERTEDEVTVLDSFYAPDGRAVVQHMAFDDGRELSRTQAAQMGREWLKDNYAQDIRFTDDRMHSATSERLSWTSDGLGISGMSLLETRGTTFLLLTMMVDDDFQETYLDTLDYTISSYAIADEE